jgi:hypothetical protein
MHKSYFSGHWPAAGVPRIGGAITICCSGAAKLHLRLIDLPVHYQERVSGATKMTRRFRNGLIMARMCWAAFLKFKLC